MLQSFTGGAHCCNTIQLAGFSNGRLKSLNLGSWDGDQIDIPTDRSGDGIADFVFNDNRYLYAFSSYASSYSPPQILNVINGKTVDVSGMADFRQLNVETMNSAGAQCVSGTTGDNRNGACPAYVATAARIGQLEQAWSRMINAYDAQAATDLPTGCATEDAAECPTDQLITFKSYPEALLYFLKENGYVAKSWLPPELRFVPDEPEATDDTMDEEATY
jgi:hypothetical protein